MDTNNVSPALKAESSTPETHTAKDMRGSWKSTTVVPLYDDYKLKIATHKTFSGALVTSASVHKLERGFETFRMYHDFHLTLAAEKVRVTEKSCVAQHMVFVKQLDEIVVRATAHQMEKDAEERAASNA